MWGKHLIIDMTAGDKERVRSAAHISRFVETLVETIGMRAYGAPLLEHFAEHVPEAAGYSLVQLIETSAITGHFCDLSGDAYIDIFSCKDFAGRARRRSGPRGLPSTTHQLHDACTPSHSPARELRACRRIRAYRE